MAGKAENSSKNKNSSRPKGSSEKSGAASSAKGQSAHSKPAAKSAQSKAAQKKTAPQSNSLKAAKERESRRFWSYILFFFGILELLITFVPGDGLWNMLYCFNRGVFGVSVFLFAPMIIYVALMIASDTTQNTVVAKVVEGTVLMLLISGGVQILQVGSVDGSDFVKKLVGLYNDGIELKGGGIASAFIGWPLLAAFKRVGAAIIIILVAFTFVMLLTNITLPQLLKAITKPFVSGYNAVTEERIERAVKKEMQDEMPKREKTALRVEKSSKGGERIDIAKYFPDDNPETAPEGFYHVDNSADSFNFAEENIPEHDMPAHPVESPQISKERLEEEAETTDNAELSRIIKKALGKDIKVDSETGEVVVVEENTDEKKADDTQGTKKELQKPATVNVDVSGQTTFFEQDNKISAYVNPPTDILKYPRNTVDKSVIEEEIQEKSSRLVSTLETYGVKTKITGIYRGPSVTRYELQPAAGVKVSKILGLADDIALNLAALSIRIEAPVPGKPCVGIEVPNDHRDTVSLRELIDSDEYRNASGKLTFAVGKDIEGKIIVGNIAKMPHLLVAGTTGSGKSVFTNSIILSVLYHASPSEVKMILIDPKKVEFNIYNRIPHLLIPVVTEPLKAAGALGWAVNEMNKRYLQFEANNVKNLEEFNEMIKEDHSKPEDMRDPVLAKINPMPQILIVIDEFADLMMAAGSEVEDSVVRLGQLARAAGIHMIIATQSPRKDVITGLIKSNIPSRVSLSVASNIDSRVILDQGGADKLLGNGDLLYKPVGVKTPLRIQSGYASTKEIKEVVSFLKNEHSDGYSEEIIHEVEENMPKPKEEKNKDNSMVEEVVINPDDELIDQAISIIVQTGNASTSFLQRKLKLGFARAARIMDEIEERGIIGPQEGAKPRKINISPEEWAEMQARR